MKKIIKLLIIGSVLFGVAACTQEKPYKEVTNKKQDVDAGSLRSDVIINDELVTEGKDHMLMVSNVGGDMNSPAIAYEIGDPMKVRFVMEKEGALSIYKLPNYDSDNLQNRKLVATIPITNVDYKCSEDDFGRCTNREVEDTDKEWYEKRFFKPKYEDVKTTAIVGLSHEYFNFSRSCFSEQSSKLVSYKLEEGALNFTVEKTFKTSASCLDAIEARVFTDLNFTTRHHYSVVEMGLLRSPDYAKKQHVAVGGNEFGYFQTVIDELDPSNRREQGNEEKLVNRWNPFKSKIKYYLAKEFAKPENAPLKKATVHAIDVINNSLKQAESKVQIELVQADKNVIEGDVRNNFIFMVEDPITRGLLGYGPSVADPDTGEILSARTVMYKGIMKMTVRGAYNDIVEMTKKQKQLAKNKEKIEKLKAEQPSGAAEGAEQSVRHAHNHAIHKHFSFLDMEKQAKKMVLKKAKKPLDMSQIEQDLQVNPFANSKIMALRQANMSLEELNDETEALIRKNFYPANLVDFHGDVEEKIQAVATKFGLKPWSLLSKAQRTEIIDTLLPVLWVPTLVHEIGHNLGLRHNFSGSYDKDNFYNAEELEKMHIHREIKYSSIMDYAHETTNELPVMGKYDIAALRYAYGVKQVTLETENGPAVVEMDGLAELVKLGPEGEITDRTVVAMQDQAGLEAALSEGFSYKSYEFCTDEHVGPNPNCNRFDEGTSLTEVAQHYIKTYEDNYKFLNLRNGRESFDNIFGTINYILYQESMFRNLRLNFERFEDIKNISGLELDSGEWETNDFLVDLKKATILSGQFFLDVLKTPAAMCAVAPASQPQAIMGLYPLSMFGDYFSHCGEVELAPGYTIVGQAGKSFKDRRYYQNPNNYIGEIDARGIWVDKLLAAKYLFGRDMSFLLNDKNYENFLSVPELVGPIIETVSDLMQDQLFQTLVVKTDPVFNTDPNNSLGEDLAMNWRFTLNAEKSHLLEVPYHPGVQRYFGIADESKSFQHHLVSTIKELNDSEAFIQEDKFIDNLLGLRGLSPEEIINTDHFADHYNQCFGMATGESCVSKFDETPAEIGEGSEDAPTEEAPTVTADLVYMAKPSNAVGLMAMSFATELPQAAAALEAFQTPPAEVVEQGEEAVTEWTQANSQRVVLIINSALIGQTPEDATPAEIELLKFNAYVLLGVYTGDVNEVDYFEGLMKEMAI